MVGNKAHLDAATRYEAAFFKTLTITLVNWGEFILSPQDTAKSIMVGKK